MTYDELVALVEAEIIDLDGSWTTQMPLIFQRAQLRIENDLDLNAAREELVFTLDAATYTLPVDLVMIQLLRTDGGSYLQLKDRSYIREYWPNPGITGTPKYFAYIDDTAIVVAPTPSNVDMIMEYTVRLPVLSNSVDTNWLSRNTPDLLQYSTLLEASIWTKDKEMETTYAERYVRALNAAALTYNLRKRTGEYRRGAPKARPAQ